jgi:hypothetical protein
VKGCDAAADAVTEERATATLKITFQHQSEGYYPILLAFTSEPLFSKILQVSTLPLRTAK